MKISVERSITQVRDGSHYKGYVKIGDSQFDYELKFRVPIPELDSLESAENENEIRRLFQITVKRDDANIDLTMEEYGFFLSLLAEFAVDFHNDQQTRGSNAGLLGWVMSDHPPRALSELSVSISMANTGLYNFSPKHYELLSAPKFGCKLTAA